jgi:hypothetical protein
VLHGELVIASLGVPDDHEHNIILLLTTKYPILAIVSNLLDPPLFTPIHQIINRPKNWSDLHQYGRAHLGSKLRRRIDREYLCHIIADFLQLLCKNSDIKKYKAFFRE